MKITSVNAIPASHTTTRVGVSVARNYVFVKILLFVRLPIVLILS